MKRVFTAVLLLLVCAAGAATIASASSADRDEEFVRFLNRTWRAPQTAERAARSLFAIGASGGGAGDLPCPLAAGPSIASGPINITVCDAGCLCNNGMLLCIYLPGQECDLRDCKEDNDNICGPGSA